MGDEIIHAETLRVGFDEDGDIVMMLEMQHNGETMKVGFCLSPFMAIDTAHTLLHGVLKAMSEPEELAEKEELSKRIDELEKARRPGENPWSKPKGDDDAA